MRQVPEGPEAYKSSLGRIAHLQCAVVNTQWDQLV